MKREDWFRGKWLYLQRFALLAGAGAVVVAVGASMDNHWLVVPGVLAIVPLMFCLVLVPLFHWKDRYHGQRSGLWGAALLIETSGWLKIVYWFRHVVPDWRKSGRYENVE